MLKQCSKVLVRRGSRHAFFTGKPQVDGLGHAFLFRNYRATLAKWQTADPIGYPDGWNQLAYGINSPADGVDVYGAIWSDRNFVEYYFRQDRKRPDYVDADQMELTSSVLLVMRDSAKDSIDNLVTLLIKSNAQDSGRTSQTIDSSFSVDCGSVVWAMGGGLGNASGNLVYRWWIEREWYQQHLYERKCYYWHFSGSLKYHDAFKDPADVLNLIEEDFEVPYGRPYEYGHVWSSQVMDNDGYIWARMVE